MWFFIEYKPVFDDTQVIENIINLAKKYLPEDKIPLILKAYEFAKKAHEWTIRLSWEPYIIHPLKATEFLMELNPDVSSIQACILHDVIEDTTFTYDDVKKEFGEDVAILCEWLVKVSKIKYKWEDRHLETIKKTFLAMAQDLRVIFIKLADRIHNIQTLQYHPNPHKITKIAEETMKIFVPIAKRLWLYHFQLYLENWAFRHLDEKNFNRIIEYLKKHFGVFGEKYIDKWKKMIKEMLEKEWIKDFIVKWRLKSPYRIFEKIETKYQSWDLSNVMDLLAYRVITKSISDCYMVLWIIHKYYTPLIKKIKDYIAIPKFNWYKSIHTTILWMFNFPIEVQIRTEKMDEIAEYWVAAHFGYSENHWPTVVSEQQAKRIEKLQKTVEEYKNAEQKEIFKENLNLEILNKSIFLYTPNGDVKELPKWSTVLDFAFSIHSDIWLKFKNAIVNWAIKPINFEPKNWDVVQINIFKNNFSATKHRLDFLHTSFAKSQLSKFLKTKQKEDLINESVKWLNKTLQEIWLPLYLSDWDKISKFYKEVDIECKLLNVLNKTEKYSSIIKNVYPNEWSNYIKIVWKNIESKNAKKNTKITIPIVVVDYDKIINYQLCPECDPKLWDKIIAKTWKDWIKIHKMSCKALKTVSFDKLMEAHRNNYQTQSYKVNIQLQTGKRHNNIIDIMTIFTELKIPILKFSIDNQDDGTWIINLESEFNNPAKISFLLADLKKNYADIKILKKWII